MDYEVEGVRPRGLEADQRKLENSCGKTAEPTNGTGRLLWTAVNGGNLIIKSTGLYRKRHEVSK